MRDIGEIRRVVQLVTGFSMDQMKAGDTITFNLKEKSIKINAAGQEEYKYFVSDDAVAYLIGDEKDAEGRAILVEICLVLVGIGVAILVIGWFCSWIGKKVEQCERKDEYVERRHMMDPDTGRDWWEEKTVYKYVPFERETNEDCQKAEKVRG